MPIPLRQDFDAAAVRLAAKRSKETDAPGADAAATISRFISSSDHTFRLTR